MHRFTLTKLLISFWLFSSTVFGGGIDVCLWTGDNPESALAEITRRYPGKNIDKVFHEGTFFLIASIDSEDYLAGVLSREMGSMYPLEALKAQAVLARTYAFNTAADSRAKNLPYDIKSSVLHQVYGVNNCPKISNAVKATYGETLSYRGKDALVFCHACCGGVTARTVDVWGGEYPHISSVQDTYCKDTPYMLWEKQFSARQLSTILELPHISNISVEKRDRSGRVLSLRIIMRNGKIRYITGHAFRMQILRAAPSINFNAPDVLPSTNFTVKRKGGEYVFEGRGYGHGVGMCQWGARRMAESGLGYRQILKHYFPEMEIKRR